MAKKPRKPTTAETASSSAASSPAPIPAQHTPTTTTSSIRTATSSTSPPTTAKNQNQTATSLRGWLWKELHGPLCVIGCMVVGAIFGFLLGTGWGLESSRPVWKQALANRIRATSTYQFVTFQGPVWDDWINRFAEWAEEVEKDLEAEEYAQNPSHPRVFAVLREAVIREEGGYVHPDLGFMVPAPSGAARGLGMVRNTYHTCQIYCLPGTAKEKEEEEKSRMEAAKSNDTLPFPPMQTFHQEEVLIRIPVNFQITRSTALETLLSIIPSDVQKKASLHDLDDSALLVLFLANERGIGRFSKWVPYIASMPPQPSCGYAMELRPYMLDAIAAYRDELGMDVQGWPTELTKATRYADKIAEGLNRDYGAYLSTPQDMTSLDNLKWALCQVASRAIAASDKHGPLRLIPVVDLINHDINAGGFIELTGNERFENGDLVNATEEDSGTFVVRSMRHSRRKPLRKGQELLANYNIPQYSPLDWFVSLGFVPPERWGRWQKIDPVLPRVRTDGPFSVPASQGDSWKEKGPDLVDYIKSLDL